MSRKRHARRRKARACASPDAHVPVTPAANTTLRRYRLSGTLPRAGRAAAAYDRTERWYCATASGAQRATIASAHSSV